MSPIVVLFALVAAAVASPPGYGSAPSYQPASYKQQVPIVSASDNRNPDSSYKFSYVSGDGSTREEYGDNYNNVQGSSYYISPEGQRITLTYTADENGFHPQGDHLPQPVANHYPFEMKVGGSGYSAPKYSAPAPQYQAPRPQYQPQPKY